VGALTFWVIFQFAPQASVLVVSSSPPPLRASSSDLGVRVVPLGRPAKSTNPSLPPWCNLGLQENLFLSNRSQRSQPSVPSPHVRKQTLAKQDRLGPAPVSRSRPAGFFPLPSSKRSEMLNLDLYRYLSCEPANGTSNDIQSLCLKLTNTAIFSRPHSVKPPPARGGLPFKTILLSCWAGMDLPGFAPSLPPPHQAMPCRPCSPYHHTSPQVLAFVAPEG
jgi:hypothetical protein